ncbi:MAG: carboxypeptidase regulatory-like domain-containing protein [Pseudomonadota bacterium]
MTGSGVVAAIRARRRCAARLRARRRADAGGARLARLGLASAGAAAILVGAAIGQGGPRAPEDEVFLGVVVRGSDLGAVFARQTEGGWLVPLDETLQILGAELREDGPRPVIATPIGARAIPADALQDIDGVPHLRTEFLAEAMSTPVRFSDELYALDVDLPWTPGDPIRADAAALDPAAAAPAPEPDATPPPFGLSRLYGDVGAGYVSGTDDFELARMDLRIAGPAFGGLWQVRFEQALDAPMTFDDPVISDYIWVRPLSDRVWGQIGNQRLSVGPLVGGAEVTGAQLAFSNRTEAFSFNGVSPGALLSRFGSGTRTFVGQGPAGGRAELWIAGRRVAAAPIGIDGRYEIVDAPLFGLQTDVEIRIFRRLGDAAPVEIREQTVTRGARFQPQGTLMALAGAGIEGNPADPDDQRGDGVAFARVMGAPFAWFTLGASGISFDDGFYVGGADGLIELGPFASASASAAADPDGLGAYEAGFSAEIGMAYLDASVFETRAGFNDRFDDDDDDDDDVDDRFDDDPFSLLEPETLDRRAAAGLRFWQDRVDLGVEARRTELSDYVLPYGSIAPMAGLSLSARPDVYGDYRFEGDYATADGFTARALRVSDTSALRLAQRVETEVAGIGAVFGDAVMRDDGGWEASAGWSGERLGDFEIDWRAEAGASDGAPLAFLSLGRPLAPGVRGYVELSSFDEIVSAYAGVSLDLAFVDGGVRSGEEAPLDMRSGAVETVFIGPDGAPLPLAPDERPVIEVDGAAPLYDVAAERSEARASFLRGSVPRGVRRVTIHEGDLPIELSPRRRVWHAKVAPATTTVLRVPLELRLGASGLLTTVSGAPAADVDVMVIDAAGQQAGRARSNRFGQFRIDGLPPGRYRARAGEAEAAFELTDDFVFGLELTGLPDPPASAPGAPLRILDRVSAAPRSAEADPPLAAATRALPIGWSRRASADAPERAAVRPPSRARGDGSVAEIASVADTPVTSSAGSIVPPPGVPVPGMRLPAPRPDARLAARSPSIASLGAPSSQRPLAERNDSPSPEAPPSVIEDRPARLAPKPAAVDGLATAPETDETASPQAPSLIEEARSLLSRASLGEIWTAATAPRGGVSATRADGDSAPAAPSAEISAAAVSAPQTPAASAARLGPALPVSELAPRLVPLPVSRGAPVVSTVASGEDAQPSRPSG